jgi:ATP-dependent Clp protease ATP-binding subunit ClpA
MLMDDLTLLMHPYHHLTVYFVCSDRFLPDKAIDLIDEAGSRVRLQHAQVKVSRVISFRLF